MTTKTEIQDLLRFLNQDAKLPLTEAMSSIKILQEIGLTSVDTISKSSIGDLKKVYSSDKSAKAVLAAAKRAVKKRSTPSSGEPTSPSKRQRRTLGDENVNHDAIQAEEALILPTSDATISELDSISLQTNRAPLVLAFAIVLLSHTYPHQPLSSRLSLAQAVVSANSRSKAVAIGLESGPSAEAEGWGEGQPRIKIMGREVRVLRRWGYELHSESTTISGDSNVKSEPLNSTTEAVERKPWTEATVPLWGLDTEKLRDANKAKAAPGAPPTSDLPIFTAQAARTYLLRSFNSIEAADASLPALKPKEQSARREQNAALLLRALDLLFTSWKNTLSRDELDRRAWNWYVAVRPDVQSGQRGWGEKGKVELKNILALRRIVDDSETTKAGESN